MILPLAYYNDPVLRKKAERVNQIDDDLHQLINDMVETLTHAKGCGLAAPQVKRSLALFITRLPRPNSEGIMQEPTDKVYLNPKILWKSETPQQYSEGCLSIPNAWFKITRSSSIKIQATDLNGQVFEEDLTGFAATNFQHEFDHLEGVLITDYLTAEEKKSLMSLLI